MVVVRWVAACVLGLGGGGDERENLNFGIWGPKNK
eukprot:SAG31_NODE_99_length_25388_cov_12.710507_20_plen_35_part_00